MIRKALLAMPKDAEAEQWLIYTFVFVAEDAQLEYLTQIEKDLIDKYGKSPNQMTCTPGAGYNKAACIKLCGRCVGTDKLAHFFEGGFMYHHIGDEDKARAVGSWLEGKASLITDQALIDWLKDPKTRVIMCSPRSRGGRAKLEYGAWADVIKCSLGNYRGPNDKCAGMADNAANLSGLKFFRELMNDAFKGDKANTFDICKYVTDEWDESKNPNVDLDRPPPGVIPGWEKYRKLPGWEEPTIIEPQ